MKHRARCTWDYVYREHRTIVRATAGVELVLLMLFIGFSPTSHANPLVYCGIVLVMMAVTAAWPILLIGRLEALKWLDRKFPDYPRKVDHAQ